MKITVKKTSKHTLNLTRKNDLLTYTRHYIRNILYSMALVCNGLTVMKMKEKRFVV